MTRFRSVQMAMILEQGQEERKGETVRFRKRGTQQESFGLWSAEDYVIQCSITRSGM
jgi:hypothetical protein